MQSFNKLKSLHRIFELISRHFLPIAIYETKIVLNLQKLKLSKSECLYV